MNDNILDQEEKKFKPNNGKRKLSGIIRFSLIYYFIYKFFTVTPSLVSIAGGGAMLLFSLAIFIMSLFTFWYNLQQGKYEFSNKPINKNRLQRYCSIIVLSLIILLYSRLLITYAANNRQFSFEFIFVLSILALLIYRDIFEIPEEIAASDFEDSETIV